MWLKALQKHFLKKEGLINLDKRTVCINLIADIAFVRAQPAVFVEPHVVVEVVLGDEHLLADFARVALLTLVHHSKKDLIRYYFDRKYIKHFDHPPTPPS